MRRFRSGDNGVLNGIRWRISNGRKAADDLRLDICVPEFRAVPMSLSFLEVDFFTENERVLYERGDPDKVMKFLRGAVILGWEAAVEQLQEEKLRKVSR